MNMYSWHQNTECSKNIVKEKFIGINAYIKKLEGHSANNPKMHLKDRDKQEQTKPKLSSQKEIVKIKDINKSETKKK